MLDPLKYSDTIGLIYDCVAAPDFWARALEQLCHIGGGAVGTLAVLDTDNHTARFASVCGDPAITIPLMEEYAAEMPMYPVLHKTEIDTPYSVAEVAAFLGPDGEKVWKNSRTYKEWALVHSVQESICMTLMKQPGRLAALNIVMPDSRPPISRQDREIFSLLAPHVRRAVTIGDLFEMERQTTGIFRNIVNSLDSPVIIVAETMRILYANPAAEEMLAAGTLVKAVRGELVAVFAPAHQALSSSVSIGVKNEVQLEGLGINVPLANLCAPAVAHVLPLPRRAISHEITSQAAAAIFFSVSGSHKFSGLDTIAALFGLTQAEKRVASHAAAGKNRNEIAEITGVRPSTIKSQLETIYDKTGTSGQLALAALMRDLSPPVRE